MSEEELIIKEFPQPDSIFDTPCFKDSLKRGLYAGGAGGFLTFMWTSRALVSYSTALGSLFIGFLSCWLPCRIKYEQSFLMELELKKRELKKKKNQELEEKRIESNQ